MRILIIELCLLFVGCWYSPWENLAYEVVGAPKSHEIALSMLEDSNRHEYDSYKINGMICNVMLKGEGCYTEERGPYTIRLMFAKKTKYEIFPAESGVKVHRVMVKRENKIVWEHNGFNVNMVQTKVENGSVIRVGDKKILVPNILDPKDGKCIQVIIVAGIGETESKFITFFFRPKVDRGSIILFD